jgi:hypothetical protein
VGDDVSSDALPGGCTVRLDGKDSFAAVPRHTMVTRRKSSVDARAERCCGAACARNGRMSI